MVKRDKLKTLAHITKGVKKYFKMIVSRNHFIYLFRNIIK